MANEFSDLTDQTENQLQVTAAASVTRREIWQMPDGRAGNNQSGTVSALSRALFDTGRPGVVPKATGVVFLPGGRMFWDHSANVATCRKVNDRDFYLGRNIGGAASDATQASVLPNVDPPYDLDLSRDPFTTAIVGTQALGGLGLYRRGGAWHFVLSSTSEVQKVDALSVDGFALGANAIIEFAFRVINKSSGTAPDISIGIASGTHASDADQIAESAFIHIDGNSLNLHAESDDGSHETAATDTTIDFVESAAVANRVEGWIDTREPNAVAFYLNGARVLSSTTFNISSATGPLFLLVHVEKSSAADVCEVAVDWMRARFSEQ